MARLINCDCNTHTEAHARAHGAVAINEYEHHFVFDFLPLPLRMGNPSAHATQQVRDVIFFLFSIACTRAGRNDGHTFA